MTILGLIQLLVAAAHVARSVIFEGEPRSRRFVSGAAAMLYTAAGVGCLDGASWALIIGVAGPILGLTTVVALGNRPDRWQLGVGVVQVGALVGSGAMLLHP